MIILFEDSDKETVGEWLKIPKKYWITFLFVGIPLFLINSFIPGSTDGLIIYGAGGCVDYLKSNPTAQKLPDKYINYLDKWIESKIDELLGIQ